MKLLFRSRSKTWNTLEFLPTSPRSFCRPATSFNLDGATLYLALTSIFVAQAAGIHLTLSAQLSDDADADVDEQGRRRRPAWIFCDSRAVPWPHFHLARAEGVALILGVDTLMDMARTSVNLLGNCLGKCSDRADGKASILRTASPKQVAVAP